MKLSKKTFLYSILLSGIIVIMVVGYFILLYPSLYVEHIERNNYNSIVALQEQYVKERSYKNLDAKNPTATITIDIPLTGNELTVTNHFFNGKVTIKDTDFILMLDKLRYYAKHPKEMDENADDWFDTSLLKEKFDDYLTDLKNLPFVVTLDKNHAPEYEWESFSKNHMISDTFYISEARVVQGESRYTTYLALTITDNTIVATIMSVTTPDMKDIMPVVFQSLPMIVAVVALLVLLLSQIFSKWIITPIIRLSSHAESAKRIINMDIVPINLRGNDEITSLGKNLNELYEKLRKNYKDLEDNNVILSLENERQEVFLRAFSHQLKTPISAALLLVQGMYEEIGKYKDTKFYLPKVKDQLISMQKIVEDIIYLSHRSENARMEEQNLDDIVTASLKELEIPITEKSLHLDIEGNTGTITTDNEMMKMIIDNLLNNAVYHTPDNGRIRIIKSYKKLQIINYGAAIRENLLPHIFEPFVTSNDRQKGHGLGLYIVRYYAQCLKCEVTVHNMNHGVEATVVWK
jgi:signal transduction histidine kinase